jgi:mercuric reductase
MKVDLKVQGMTCLDCARHIETALRRVEGVEAATVDYRGGRATVELKHDVPERELLAAVGRAGYRAEVAGQVASSNGAPSTTATAAREPGIAAVEPSDQDIPSRARAVRAAPPEEGDGTADFDLLVIGTGGAGVAAAIQAAGMGAKVGIVESDTLGGTCVNVGCIPSKNLIEAAAYYRTARTGFQGIASCEPALDWRAVIRQKNELVGELRQAKYADVLASYPGISMLAGRATLLGRGLVRVGDAEHRARKVIIATGTSPVMPPIPGLAQARPLDSTTAMELEELPKSMIVLGGSAVGLELGQTFARFGTKVIVVELMPHLLPNEDETISEALRKHLTDEGIEIHTGVTTTRVERHGSDVAVYVTQGTLAGQFRAQQLLVATGRRPNTRGMGLEDAGVALTENGFVRVDAMMRTSNPDLYAAGDVTGGPGYVYVAAAGGRVAAENALKSLSPTGTPSDELRELDLSAVPNVTFTSPQVGSVGLTEAKARESGYNVDVSVLAMEHVPRALVSRDTRGLVKIVAEAGSGKLLGVHAVAPNAGEFMGEATLAVRFGLTVRDLMATLHPYLTWIESLKLAAQGFTSDVTKLSCCA